jgi:hypothetical protein
MDGEREIYIEGRVASERGSTFLTFAISTRHAILEFSGAQAGPERL